MVVLSLFDGISCGKVALEKAGVRITRYTASEIEPDAIRIAIKNHPEIRQVGDVTKLPAGNLRYTPDLIIGGSPCQGFSFAGKQLNFDDPRSKLFFEFVRVLNEVKAKNPDVLFLLENVVMSKQSEQVITDYLGVQPVMLNSADFSGQTRKRLYWANFSILPYNDTPSSCQEVLNSVGQGGVTDRKKSHCIAASVGRTGRREYFYKHQGGMVFIKEPSMTDNTVTVADGVCEVPALVDGVFCKKSFDVRLVPDGVYSIRKYSVEECEALQGLPVGYTDVPGISKGARYTAIGNGWQVDTLTHIFKSLA